MKASVALATLQASSLIQKARYKKAFQVLQSSLVSLRPVLATSEGVPHPPILGAEGPNAPRPVEMHVEAIPASSRPTGSEASCKVAQQGVFVLYDKLLTITVPPEQADAGDDGVFDDECVLLGAVVLYNMALCHHLRGVQAPRTSSGRCILKAIKLYELALQALSATTSSLSPNDGTARLALLNNLGHAHQHFRDAASSQSCLDQLAAAVRSGLDAREGGAAVRDLPFFALTSLLHATAFATAPAA